MSLASIIPRIEAPAGPDTYPLNVVTHNIYKGALDTYPLLLDYYSAQPDIDVLCFQEADEWHHDNHARIKDFAATTGFNHYVFGDTNTDAKLLVFSKWKIVESEVYTDEFFHGAIRAVIQVGNRRHGVITTHLNPYDEDERLREAQFLAAEVERLADETRHLGEHAVRYITTMDANGPSREDPHTDRLLRDLKKHGNERYIGSDGGLRYDVADFLASQGFIDAAVVRGAKQRTFPARTDTEAHPPKIRLDRIYVPSTLQRAITRVKVLRNRQTKRLSDHYPLWARIRVPIN